jgi:transposase
MATRRTFSEGKKLRVLVAADACAAPGEIGALLRREKTAIHRTLPLA